MTRLEINFRRLLNQCEGLAKDDDTKSSWRLDKVNKYLVSLHTRHNQIFCSTFWLWKTCSQTWRNIQRKLKYWSCIISTFEYVYSLFVYRKASKEMMADYSKRVEFLKGLRMADQLVRLNQLFVFISKNAFLYYPLQPTVPEKVAAAQMLPHSSTSEGSDVATEIQQKTRSKYNNELRDQLFQLDNGNFILL